MTRVARQRGHDVELSGYVKQFAGQAIEWCRGGGEDPTTVAAGARLRSGRRVCRLGLVPMGSSAGPGGSPAAGNLCRRRSSTVGDPGNVDHVSRVSAERTDLSILLCRACRGPLR